MKIEVDGISPELCAEILAVLEMSKEKKVSMSQRARFVEMLREFGVAFDGLQANVTIKSGYQGYYIVAEFDKWGNFIGMGAYS